MTCLLSAAISPVSLPDREAAVVFPVKMSAGAREGKHAETHVNPRLREGRSQCTDGAACGDHIVYEQQVLSIVLLGPVDAKQSRHILSPVFIAQLSLRDVVPHTCSGSRINGDTRYLMNALGQHLALVIAPMGLTPRMQRHGHNAVYALKEPCRL